MENEEVGIDAVPGNSNHPIIIYDEANFWDRAFFYFLEIRYKYSDAIELATKSLLARRKALASD